MSNEVRFTVPITITITIGQPQLTHYNGLEARTCNHCGCTFWEEQPNNYSMCAGCQNAIANQKRLMQEAEAKLRRQRLVDQRAEEQARQAEEQRLLDERRSHRQDLINRPLDWKDGGF